MRRGVWVFAAIGFCVLIAAGCWNPFSSGDNGGGGNGDVYKRDTPDNLLNFFAQAYENQDIDQYAQALDEYFEFEFTPEVADSLGLPEEKPWWGKVEDKQSTKNMFDDPEVTGIEMHFEPAAVGLDWQDCEHPFIEDGGAEPETTWIEGLCQLFEPDIKVHIEKPGEEILTLWVNNSYLDIMVRPDPDYPDLWTILRIVESVKDH